MPKIHTCAVAIRKTIDGEVKTVGHVSRLIDFIRNYVTK